MNAMRKMRRQGFVSSTNRARSRAAMLIFAAAGAAAVTAHAQNNVYQWTGDDPGSGTITAPVSGNWSDPLSWFNTANSSTGVAVSAANTELDFGGSGSSTYAATYDSALNNAGGTVTGPFTLNEIQLFSTASVAETIAPGVATNTLSFTSNGAVTPQLLQNGTGGFNINAGLVLTNNLLVGGSGSGALNLNGNITGTANLTLAYTGGVLNIGGNNTYSGITTINGGTVNYTGTASSIGNGVLDVGNAGGTTTVLNWNAAGPYNFSGNATVADNATSSAAIIQTSGTANIDQTSGGYFTVGNDGYGSYTLSGTGALNVGSANNSTGIRVGFGTAASLGSFVQTGGTISTNRYFSIGSTGTGTATFTGGTFTGVSFRVLVGDAANTFGTLNIGTEAGGNSLFSPGPTGIYLVSTANTTATSGSDVVNLNSGTVLITGTGIIKNASGTGVLNLNGATVASSTTGLTLINNTPTSVNDYNGGAVFNVSGSGISDTMSANLLATTGNGLYPASGLFPITSGGAGYIGNPLVTIIGGGGTGATAIANVSNGVVTGVIITNPGQGYTAGQPITFNFSGGGATTPLASFTTNLSSSSLVANGTGGLTKIGTGILVVNGASTYTGPTAINGGVLNVGSAGALGATSSISFGGGTLQFSSANTTDYSPQFSTAAGQNYSIDTNGQKITFNTALSSSGGTLTKVGAGTLTLTAPATYSGATTINAGTLAIAPSSGLVSSTINVAANATFNPQPGPGTMTLGSGSAAVTVAGGGTLDMTDNSIGTLNINAGSGTGLTLGSSSGTTPATVVFQIGASTVDNISVTGGVSVLSSGASLKIEGLSSSPAITPGDYTLITASGGLTNASSFSLFAPVVASGGIYDLSLSQTATSEILNVTQDNSIASAYWAGTVSGAWNANSSGNTNWNTDATSGINAGAVPGPSTNVFFTVNSGGANLGTTLGANTSINSLTFTGSASGPISIAAGNSLTIYGTDANGNTAGNGITIQPDSATAPVTIGSAIVLGGTQTWTNNDPNNALIVNGVISGPFQLTQAGVGTLTLNGANTFSGGLYASSGTLNINNASALGTGTFTISGPVAIDNTNASGGTVTLAATPEVWNSNFTFNGTNNLNLGTGAITLGNNVQLTLNAKTLGVGGTLTDANNGYTLTTTGAGNLNVTGSITGSTSLVLNGTGIVNVTGAQTYAGGTTINSGTLNYNNGGTNLGTAVTAGVAINNGILNYNSSGTSSFNNNGNPFILGANAGQGGALYVSAGTLNMITATSGNGYLQLGNNGGYGYVGVTAGTLNSGSATVSSGFRVGSGTGSYGVVLQTGGSLTSHRYFVIGSGSGDAVTTFTGGTAALGTDGFAVYLGETGSGVLNVGTEAGGTAQVTAASTVASNGGIRMATAGGGSGSLNLDSGTLIIDSAGIYTASTAGQSVVNLNGGTLMPGAANLDLIPNTINAQISSSANLAVTAVNVYNRGAIVNTNGSNATISNNLLATTGDGIYKNAAFTAAATGAAGSGYIGAPLVGVSGGTGTGAAAIANVDLNPADPTYGQITGFTMTDPGQGYVAGDALTFTLIGGVSSTGTAAAPYSYTLASTDLAANNGGLTKMGAGTLSLAGNNTYTGTTNVSAGTLQVNPGGTLGSGPVLLGSGTLLNFNNSSPLSVQSTISGAGGFQQIGPGTTTFSAASNYSGATNVSAGKLVLASTASLGNTAISVASGAILNTQTGGGTMTLGTGTASLTLLPGSTFDMTDGTIGTTKINSGSGAGLTIGAATGTPATLIFTVGNSTTDQLIITGTGSVLASGAKISLVPLLSDTSINTSVTYPLVTATGGLSSNNGAYFSLASSAINIGGQLYDASLSSTSTTEGVSFTADSSSLVSAYWAGSQNGLWNTDNAQGTNWRTDATGSTDPVKIPTADTNVFFSINGGGANQATNLGANTSINTLSFTNSGSSTPISISGYTLTINSSPTLNSDASGAGITVQNGAPAVTINSGIALGGSQTWVSNSSNPFTIAGVISGPATSTITMSAGTGAITLSGSNTFTGGLNVQGGFLNVNSPGALGAGTFTISGPVVLDNTSGSPQTLTVPQQAWNSSFTFNGSNDLNMGTGNISLGAPVTVTLNAGNLTLGNTITDNGSGLSITSSGPGNLNLTGSVTGATSLIATGPGAMNISGNNSYTGSTNVSGGTLNFTGTASSSQGGALLVAVGSGTAVANFNSSGTIVFTNAAAAGYQEGSGAIYQSNGTLNLTPSGSLLALGGAGYFELGANPGQTPTSYGYYLMTGGTLNTLGATGIRVGDGGYGVFTQAGGVINISRYFAMTSPGNGAQSGGYSVASFLGGVFNGSTGGYNVRIADDAFGTSVLNLGTMAGGTSLMNLTSATDGGLLELTDSNSVAGSYGIANLNNGTIRFNGALGIFKGSYYTNANLSSGAIVNLNGATLQAGVDGVSFIDNTVDAAYVYSGNAIFDTNNHSGGLVSANLIPAQGNGITTATFNLPSGSQGAGYIGAPVVTINPGSGNALGPQQYAYAVANVINGQVVSVTMTNPGQGYNVGDTLNFSFAGGAPTSTASYNYTLTAADVAPNAGGLVKNGLGDLTLTGSNSYLGTTQVNAGSLIFGTAASLPVNNNLNIASGATAIAKAHAANSSSMVLQVGTLNIAGAAGNWTGLFDLTNNDLVVQNGSIATITNQIKQGFNAGGPAWQGSGGITSSLAAADTTHLTALGVMINDTGANSGAASGNPIYTSLDNTPVSDGEILVKYTYYGDANLSGTVDASDYSLIDNGYLHHLTGWYNGDFNYDGVINGSDYTLIDNAFNMQGASLADAVASPDAVATAQRAGGTSAVPEPATLGLMAIAAAGMLGRRRRN